MLEKVMVNFFVGNDVTGIPVRGRVIRGNVYPTTSPLPVRNLLRKSQLFENANDRRPSSGIAVQKSFRHVPSTERSNYNSSERQNGKSSYNKSNASSQLQLIRDRGEIEPEIDDHNFYR